MTGQCAETIQVTIVTHYTLKRTQKENGNSVSEYIKTVAQQFVIKQVVAANCANAKSGICCATQLIPPSYNK
ncbi:hypothetical protein D8W73_16240 [Citrobacter amalonaticus]|nr:hypothetical protein [Citrobacter amalonaticus]